MSCFMKGDVDDNEDDDDLEDGHLKDEGSGEK